MRLSDVARVEIGADSYQVISRLNGRPAAGMTVRLAPGANALTTIDAVKKRATELAASLPEGMELSFPVDNTRFIRISIREVIYTLIEAIALVILVMWVFLQNWRTTLIPGHRGAGGAVRHVRRARGVRLHDQHADAVRAGAIHRSARRRRDRGDRERRAHHARGADVAARRDAQVDAADHRRADRHRAGAVGGVRADGVLRRIDRRDLSPVLGNDRLGHGAVDLRRAGAHAGAVRNAAEAGAVGTRGTPRLVLHEVQLDIRERSRALRACVGANTRHTRPRDGGVRRRSSR